MRLNRIDLNLMTVFDVVYAERNLTRAAEVLHITQPAVSNALTRLRATFDDPLFVRTAAGMIPTPVARNVVSRVRKALQLIESCVEPQTGFNPASSEQTLLCSFSGLAEVLLLPLMMTKVESLAPNMAVRSFPVPRTELPTELAAGSLDIAVDVASFNDRNLLHAPLFEDHYVCAVRPNHPQVQRQPTLQQYLQLGHVHISSRRKGAGDVDQRLKSMGHRRTIVTRVSGYATAPHIVTTTDLACTMPRSLAKQSGLKVFSLPFDVPPVNIHMYWHKSTDADPANIWLRNLLFEVLGQLRM